MNLNIQFLNELIPDQKNIPSTPHSIKYENSLKLLQTSLVLHGLVLHSSLSIHDPSALLK